MKAMPKRARAQNRLALALAMAAGYVDGFGLLQFQTYLSFMSGNTTQTGANIGRADSALALPSAIAVGSFLAGAVLGNLLKSPGRREAATLASIGVMLGAASIALWLKVISINGAIAVIAAAMGVMNTTLTRIGDEQINLAFVTGTLSKLGRHIALAAKGMPLADAQGPWDTQIGRAIVLTGIWLAFLVGAILAGFAASRLGDRALLPASGFLILVALVVGWTGRGE